MFVDPDLPDQEFPDEVDRVVEVADMMTVFAAERLVRVDQMRREALAAATRNGRVLTDVVERGIRLELATALRITEHAAGTLLTFAEATLHSFPSVLRSMERARITEDHARVLVTALSEIEPDFRAIVLEKGLELAESEPLGTFRRKLRTLIDVTRSASLTERFEAAVTRRRSVIEPEDDGMGWLHVYGPMVAIHAAHARATAMAKAIRAADAPDADAAPDLRTLEQVRTDVILDLLVEGRTDVHPEAARGIKATVTVTVPVLALLNETDEARAAAGIEPPVIEGMIPIPLAVAKELAGSSAGWTRVLTHPGTGMVLSVGREHYRPPPALAKLARWRADRCMGPGCGMPASRCEVDHNIDWAKLGETALNNLAPLCKGHHIVRHHTDWTIEQVEGSGGAIRWTSPTGRRYLVEPERRVPVFRAASAGGTGDAPF
jgi:hypothetical protein